MAKSAKRKAPIAAVRNTPKTSAPNPFEKANGKQKFNIIGRKHLSTTRNINKARSEAVDKRKKTLLVEYKQLKRANAFVDRRIGEYDEELTEEEKAIARFQKERLRRARKNKFTLTDEDGAATEGLTHLGNPLSTLDDLKGSVPAPEDHEDNEGYELADARVVSAAHFGGGAEAGADRRTKKEVMAEVMAVSKAARAEKRMLKEEDEDLLDTVDQRFDSLLKSKSFQGLRRAPGERHKVAKGTGREVSDDPTYDEVRVAVGTSARAHAADREPTQHELAERERAAAEAIEGARKRQVMGDAESAEAALPTGGYAARRAKAELGRRKAEEAEAAAEERAAGAEGEDDFDLSSGEEGAEEEGGEGAEDLIGAAATRRAQRAAGNDPLQKGLRVLTAQLMLKHGAKPTSKSLQELEEGQGGDDLRSGEDGGADGESEGGDDSGSETSESCDGKAEDEGVAAAAAEGGEPGGELEFETESGSGDEGECGVGREEELDESDIGSIDEEEQAAIASQMDAATLTAGRPQGAVGGSAGGSEDDSALEDDDALLALLKQAIAIKQGAVRDGDAPPAAPEAGGKAAEREPEAHLGSVRQADEEDEDADVHARVPEAPRLPQDAAEFAQVAAGLQGRALGVLVERIRSTNAHTLNADNRVRLQALYGVVMSHYAAVAARRPPQKGILEGLVQPLAMIAAEVPLYAASHARTHLRAMFDNAYAALEEHGVPGWPGARGLLLLQLFSVLFPAQDPKHAVVAPQALVLGFLLSHCPPGTLHDVATGVLIASMLLGVGQAAQRFAAEVLPFCEALLHSAVTPKHRIDEGKLCLGHMRICRAWLSGASGTSSGPPQPLQFWSFLSRDPTSPEAKSAELKAACFMSVLGLVREQLKLLNAQASPALEACMVPMQRALSAVVAHGAVSAALKRAAQELQGEVAVAVQESIAQRQPMVCAALVKKVPVRLLNPKFEVDFDKRRDYDPDRERSEFTQYKRLAAKEKRALKRELTRDAAFMGEVRRKEVNRAANARDKKAKRAVAFLEQQEADFKSGGQGGMNPHKKKRK